MKQIVVRFIYEPDMVSRLIGWTTNSLWSHCEALSRDGESWIGAHAVTGVETRPFDWCKPTRERVYALPVTDAEYETAMGWLEAQVGIPYNYLDILGLAIHVRIGASEHEMICSACMLAFIMMGGYNVPNGKAALNVQEGFSYLVTPETLHLSPVWIGHGITL